MIQLIRSLNLARAIILFSILGSCYLAWINWEQYQEVKDLRSRFSRDVADVCQEIQTLSLQHTKLSGDIAGDRYLNQASPESYIRQIADDPQVNIGIPDINYGSSARPGGILDNTFTIRPTDRKREFTHDHIARFLYKLEAESPQIKVTSIKLDLQGKNIKPGDIPADAWTWTTVMTNRIKDTSRSTQPAGR